MHDYLMKEYTIRILNLAKQHSRLLVDAQTASEPEMEFLSRSSDSLVLLDHMKHIMHSLSTDSIIKTRRAPKMKLNFDYLELGLIDKDLLVLTAEGFGELVERIYLIKQKKDDIVKLGTLFHNIVAASRLNPIGVFRTARAESMINAKFERLNICILVNYYFFRKLDDDFRKYIFDLSSLKKYLSTQMKPTPFMFIITDKTRIEKLDKIFDNISNQIFQVLRDAFMGLSV